MNPKAEITQQVKDYTETLKEKTERVEVAVINITNIRQEHRALHRPNQ